MFFKQGVMQPADSDTIYGSGIVNGNVWLDNNGDGSIDDGEVGFQGINVNVVDASTHDVLGSGTTDSDGNYRVVVSTYVGEQLQIQVVFPSGDEATIQGGDSTIDANGYSTAFAMPATFMADAPAGGIRSIVVTTPQDDVNGAIQNQVTLRDAIETGVNAGGAAGFQNVTFQAGVTGTIGLQAALPNLSTNVTIAGPGSSNLTVQGNANAGNMYSVFSVNPGITMKISGLTIAGGFDTTGGGIFNGGDLTLMDDVIQDNTATQNGGGISNNLSNTSLAMQDVTVQFNTAEAGGGIYNAGSIVSSIPDGVYIIANTATADGGGMYNLGTVELGGTVISGNGANTTSGSGGGVYNGDGASFILSDGSISNNDAFQGGGVYNMDDVTLEQSTTVQGNSAGQAGGMYLSQFSTTNFDGVTVSENKATGAFVIRANGVGYVQRATMNIANLTDNDDPNGKPVKI